jgi:hypothetical protein
MMLGLHTYVALATKWCAKYVSNNGAGFELIRGIGVGGQRISVKGKEQSVLECEIGIMRGNRHEGSGESAIVD